MARPVPRSMPTLATMPRRHFLGSAGAALAAPALWPAAAWAQETSLQDAGAPFSFDALAEDMRARAADPPPRVKTGARGAPCVGAPCLADAG